jgi:hypothetical protein
MRQLGDGDRTLIGSFAPPPSDQAARAMPMIDSGAIKPVELLALASADRRDRTHAEQ